MSQSPPCIRNRVETIELTRRLEPIPDEEIVGLFPGDILAELINVAGVLLSLPRPLCVPCNMGKPPGPVSLFSSLLPIAR